MKLFYKSKDSYSYDIQGKLGYFLPLDEGYENFLLQYIRTGYDGIHGIIVEHEDEIFIHELEIMDRINENADGYFDFDKAILDIGAFIGQYSWYTKFKYVYAIEPNKQAFTLLNMNLLMNDKLENSKTFNILLSDKKETVNYDGFHSELTDQPNDFLHSVYSIPKSFTSIESHFLDELNLSNIGFIKIDVEGMEEKVLRGGIGTIVRNNYPPILFELWEVGFYNMTQEKHDSMENFLKSLGYEIIWNWGDNMTHLAIHK